MVGRAGRPQFDTEVRGGPERHLGACVRLAAWCSLVNTPAPRLRVLVSTSTAGRGGHHDAARYGGALRRAGGRPGSGGVVPHGLCRGAPERWGGGPSCVRGRCNPHAVLTHALRPPYPRSRGGAGHRAGRQRRHRVAQDHVPVRANPPEPRPLRVSRMLPAGRIRTLAPGTACGSQLAPADGAGAHLSRAGARTQQPSLGAAQAGRTRSDARPGLVAPQAGAAPWHAAGRGGHPAARPAGAQERALPAACRTGLEVLCRLRSVCRAMR